MFFLYLYACDIWHGVTKIYENRQSTKHLVYLMCIQPVNGAEHTIKHVPAGWNNRSTTDLIRPIKKVLSVGTNTIVRFMSSKIK